MPFAKGAKATPTYFGSLSGALGVTNMSHRYTTLVGSDVVNDGMYVELRTEDGTAVADVFRSDRDHTLVLNTFGFDVPLAAIQLLLDRAWKALEPFEDGTSLASANMVESVRVRPGGAK